MRIEAISCLEDNYAYLLVNRAGTEAVVIDPSEAEPVRSRLTDQGLRLRALWLTHHHWDHTGGVDELVEHYPDIEVLGSAYDMEHQRIPHQSRGLHQGDALDYDGRKVAVMEIPGHTLGAIAFVVDGNLFSGDTLFLAGCGRVFEGTMEQMTNSLRCLRELPEETKLWCGHEYTVSNLKFAQTVEPNQPAIAEALHFAEQKRKLGQPTIPGTLKQESRTNPFFRYDVASVAQGRGAVEAFTALRKAKDNF